MIILNNLSITLAVGAPVSVALAWWGYKQLRLHFRWRDSKRTTELSIGSTDQLSEAVDASKNIVKGNMTISADAPSARANENKVDKDMYVDFRRK